MPGLAAWLSTVIGGEVHVFAFPCAPSVREQRFTCACQARAKMQTSRPWRGQVGFSVACHLLPWATCASALCVRTGSAQLPNPHVMWAPEAGTPLVLPRASKACAAPPAHFGWTPL